MANEGPGEKLVADAERDGFVIPAWVKRLVREDDEKRSQR